MVLPTRPSFPGPLAPTQAQMSNTHSSWISLLPFPKMRETLIRWEACFDHTEFVKDLIGNLMDHVHFSAPQSSQRPGLTLKLILSRGSDDEARSGLIVWGEPYRAGSWEATPGFLCKWAWAV
ncbi:hypothetical protein NUU61_003080 [Penicillium alfredii]|uniref:Uncharacterized protein n=1 Tax=Penicillium alfredii TaxID=1506179 RepID=A0A9W9KHJ4_9EURO|nr:uncharacterized protein NUU61_003080 [Penicillium alfredii]KAJ5105733.1 hypothetical protein NUU61_003080 [Penicillium alfredii]